MLKTWEDFQRGVRDLLPVDDERCGVQTFIDKHIRAAVIDLMHHVPCMRINMETLYEEKDIQQDGTASLGKMPVCGEPFEARYLITECEVVETTSCQLGCTSGKSVKTLGGCVKMTPKKAVWSTRHQLACQCAASCYPLVNRSFLALSPDGVYFYSFPPLKEDRVELLILWQKGYPDWDDEDITTLSEKEELGVADWVKSKLALQMGEAIESKLFMASYEKERMRIFKNCKRRKDLSNWQNHE